MSNFQLCRIEAADSEFGQSFGGSKGPSEFYQIFSDTGIIGEIEYSPQHNEILSIYINGEYRNRGIAKYAVMQLFDFYETDQMVAWASKSSIPFWEKIATKRLVDDYFLIEKLNF